MIIEDETSCPRCEEETTQFVSMRGGYSRLTISCLCGYCYNSDEE